ncbi:porin family protein [Methylobrevis sp. L22]|uniref:Porin family protein n=2 Tax=Methylobrevis albus TaxID=2793297 RepID=A0A931I0Z7_9HYPH|nr:porin family protein [Methylobrevis albus]
MTLRTLLLSMTATAMLAGTAHAADVMSDSPFVPEAAPYNGVYDWSGVYLGVQGGYGFGDSRIDDNGITGLDASLDTDGWFAGGIVGYQYQWNSVVFGIEGEFNWSDFNETAEVQPGNFVGNEVDWFASVNGKLGYALDRILIYGTAGVAFADISTNQRTPGLGASFSQSENYTGWTVGAGIDYAATENIIVGLQYRYYDFGSADYSAVAPFTPRDQDLDVHTISAHLTYKF